MIAERERPTITDAERRFHIARRQAIIIELGAIEDYLGMERSIIPRRKRDRPNADDLFRRFDRLTSTRREVKYGES